MVDSLNITVDPVRRFVVNGEVCKLKSVVFEAAVASNQQVIAAVTGKRIRVMGYSAQSDTTTQGSFLLTDGSGGRYMFGPYFAPPTTAEPLQVPVIDSGYDETSTGVGLFVGVGTAAVNLNVYYIEYTPRADQ